MLAFDIETEGLDSRTCRITVACVYDPDRGIQRAFNFVSSDDDKEFAARRDAFLQCLDDAPALCSFNGVRFDIPFIARRFDVPARRQGEWVLKLFDPFEVCKLGFGGTCSLNKLLMANGYCDGGPESCGKTGTGLQAIEWARNRDWEPLEEYCMADAVLTHRICTQAHKHTIRLPLTGWAAQGDAAASCSRDPETNEIRVFVTSAV